MENGLTNFQEENYENYEMDEFQFQEKEEEMIEQQNIQSTEPVNLPSAASINNVSSNAAISESATINCIQKNNDTEKLKDLSSMNEIQPSNLISAELTSSSNTAISIPAEIANSQNDEIKSTSIDDTEKDADDIESDKFSSRVLQILQNTKISSASAQSQSAAREEKKLPSEYEKIEVAEEKSKQKLLNLNTENDLDLNKVHIVLKVYAEIMLKYTDAPIKNIVGSFLAALASQIKNGKILFGSREIYANLWIIINGISTISRKSTCLNLARQMLLLKHNEYYQKYLEDLKNWEEEKKTNKNAVPPTRQIVILPVSITSEKLFSTLKGNKNVILIEDELFNLLSRMLKNYNGDLKAVLTAMFDVIAVLEKETKTGGLERIEAIQLNILAATTPDWLVKAIESADVGSGFLARFLFLNTTKRNRELMPIPETMPTDVLKDFIQLLNDLSNLNTNIYLSDQAKILYVEFYKKNILKLESHSFADKLAPFFNRLITDYLLKFCLIFTAIDMAVGGAENIVTPLCMQQAIYLTEFFLKECEQIVLGNFVYCDIKLESRIIEKLKKSDNISRANLMRELGVLKKDFDNAIESLIDKDLIIKKIITDGKKKSKTVYQLNK